MIKKFIPSSFFKPFNKSFMSSSSSSTAFDYDLFVIGGGSGGLAASKASAQYGARVAVADFVKPSDTLGTTWGLGGTCVNVGCIPKKLFHLASLNNDNFEQTRALGWKGEIEHSWESLVNNATSYIKSLNFKYKSDLRTKNVKYINSFATLVDKNTILLTDKNGKTETVTSKYILIAVGGRPSLGNYPGVNSCCISSDDIFWRKTPPGKTLVVGASYIALECAGFIRGLGYDVTVMVRSIILRGFDQDIATRIGNIMENHGTKFLRGFVPTRFEKVDNKVHVYFKQSGEVSSETSTAEFGPEIYDTVLMAVGRTGCANWLGDLDKIGLKHSDGKLITNKSDQTSVDNIYAIGDVCKGRPELTPVAISAGKLLSSRLFGNSSTLMDYDFIPTTVFTPIEYGTIGISEDKADLINSGEKGRLTIFHSYFKPLDWNLVHDENSHKLDTDCYIKLIVDNKLHGKVVGIHILGPNAGEIIQALSIAVKAGATKEHFDTTLGIHPTDAETLCNMTEVKSNDSELATGGGC